MINISRNRSCSPFRADPPPSHCWWCWRHCGRGQDQNELGTEQPWAAGLPQKGIDSSVNHCSHSSFLLEDRGLGLLLQVPSPGTALPIPTHLLWGQKEPPKKETPHICQVEDEKPLWHPEHAALVSLIPRCAPGAAGRDLPASVPGTWIRTLLGPAGR